MKTIKERAKAYADNYVVGDFAIIVDLIHKVAEESYIAGATEMEEIDDAKYESIAQSYETGFAQGQEVGEREMLDKACEWLGEHAKAHGEADGLDAVYLYDTDMLVRHFRKAMEE